jgi:DNA-binding response OmpR family regulator
LAIEADGSKLMHILVIEDTKNLAQVLKQGLEERGHTVTMAFDGATGLAHTETADFDAVILDLMLPRMDGTEVIRRMRAADNITPVLALTARDTVQDIIAGLDRGFDDYLTKPFAITELMARLRAIVRRQEPKKKLLLQVADLTLDPVSGGIKRGDESINLTRTELLLLEYMMRRADAVLTRTALIERVWGHNAEIGENTLEAFIRTLRTKVDANHPTKLIHTVRGVGYRLGLGDAR